MCFKYNPSPDIWQKPWEIIKIKKNSIVGSALQCIALPTRLDFYGCYFWIPQSMWMAKQKYLISYHFYNVLIFIAYLNKYWSNHDV